MQVVHGLWEGVDTGFFMFWATLWALVLGFTLSGAVQAFVSRTQMQETLGDHAPKTLAKSSFFGAVSSSCSYASSALAKSLFARGADFTASVVFMIASTNLVLELGIVLWLLIGWQFALAEFVGGAIMIVLLGLVTPRVIPASWLDEARDRLDDGAAGEQVEEQNEPLRKRLRSRRGWGDASGYTISDLSMLRKELFIGFAVAGFLAALVPTWFWQSIFLTGHGFWSSLENVIIGPFLALISFVCSVGNVPLAAALWKGGISFGGVVSFVFADLITLPLLAIYRKYYGTKIMLRLLAVMWATMSVGGLAVEYLFRLLRIPAPGRPTMVVHEGFQWNYTTFLNIVSLAGFAVLYWLYKHRDTDGGRFAKDPVCGMQVEIANAPAHRKGPGGDTVYFCSDHCAHRYDATDAGDTGTGGHPGEAGDQDRSATDPVCGMDVQIADAPSHREDPDGDTVYFCSEHCAQQYDTTGSQPVESAPATVGHDTTGESR